MRQSTLELLEPLLQVLRAHPAVAEVAVYGLPDERWGEVVAAAIVTAEPTGEPQLAEHCRSSLPSSAVPRRWRFVDEIPRTPLGKVDRRSLVGGS